MAGNADWRNRAALVAITLFLWLIGTAWAGQKLLVELADGSKIFGDTNLEALTLASEVVGRMRIPLTNVAVVVVGKSNELSRLTMANGDQMHGAMELPEVSLTAVFGPVRIPTTLIKQLRTVAANGLVTRVREGLVLYYSFDSDDGATVRDQSGHGHDGEVAGASYAPDGGAGGAYRFDGRGDHIRVRSSELLRAKAFTASAWVRIRAKLTGEDYGILGNHSAGKNVDSFLLRLRQGRLNVWFAGQDSATIDEALEELPPGRWTMVTLTFAENTARIYLNGQAVMQRSLVGYRGGEYDFLIGAQEWNNQSPQRFWNGWIDEVRLYDRALSAEEVKTLSAEFAEHDAADGR